jgi:hypothetical protein
MEKVTPLASEMGKMKYLITTFRLFAGRCATIVDNVKCNNPWTADQYQAMADTWNYAAQIVEELISPRGGLGGDVPDMGIISRNVRLVERLLYTMTVSDSLDVPNLSEGE